MGEWSWGTMGGRLGPMKPREPMSVAYYRKAARLPKRERVIIPNRQADRGFLFWGKTRGRLQSTYIL